MRKIVHVDMDAFYASVEQRDRPELRGQPVVVAWESQRSVVCAASYEARKYGVRSAMPALRARELCPPAVFLRPDFARYRAASHQIRDIFARHTTLVEPLSLDEAYLDVTENLQGIPSATAVAEAIRAAVREETGLTASAGVAPNKFLAKIASDWKKPDGLFVIKPHHVERFLPPLPVGRLPGIGRASERLLEAHKVKTVGDLQRLDRRELRFLFGSFGDRLFDLARGIDERPVIANQERKQISSENTFPRDLAMLELRAFLIDAGRDVWSEAEKRHRLPRTVTVKLRTPDFTTRTRSATPQRCPHNADEVIELALDLLARFDFPPESRFRLAGLGLSNFIDQDTAQPRLW